MNARMYDPKLGRFLQPDSYIQFPETTQGFNRYTYVNNNPLSYTDPRRNETRDASNACNRSLEFYSRARRNASSNTFLERDSPALVT